MKSFVSEKIEVKKSDIDRLGMYAKEQIKKGEVVFVKGGHIVTKQEMYTSSRINSYLPLSDTLFMAAMSFEEEEGVKLYCNHSCNPNCGVHGEITFIAIRDIACGEELTIDYAFVDNEEYSFECHCGSDNCRGIVTGFDWKIGRLQKDYYPYFAQYIKDKIDSSWANDRD